MKKMVKTLTVLFLVLFIASCEKDEGKLPDIKFKTGSTYTSADAKLDPKTKFTIGIIASKTEDKDVLKKINISKSINGGAATTVFDKDLGGSEGDVFNYDYTADLEDVSMQTNRYTFTVTNRDGLVNQVALTITIN